MLNCHIAILLGNKLITIQQYNNIALVLMKKNSLLSRKNYINLIITNYQDLFPEYFRPQKAKLYPLISAHRFLSAKRVAH